MEGRHDALRESFTSKSGVSELISRSEANVQSQVLLGPTSVHSISYWLAEVWLEPDIQILMCLLHIAYSTRWGSRQSFPRGGDELCDSLGAGSLCCAPETWLKSFRYMAMSNGASYQCELPAVHIWASYP